MQRNLFKIIGVILFVFVLGRAAAQEIRVNAVLDTSRIRIGEQAKIDLYLDYNSAGQKQLQIEWPQIGDTITGKVEVVSVTPIDTTIPDKNRPSNLLQHQQVTVSVYDSGFYAIPGFKFIIDHDTAHPVYTQPLFLEVHTVPTDSSAAKIKDIKPPFGEPFNWRWYMDYIVWSIVAILAIAIIIILLYYRSWKNNKQVAEPEKPKVPAHITALYTLEKIRHEQIWKENQVKEYYSSISDAIRLYIEERFGVNALESTTDEIMTAFRSQVVDRDSKEKLQQLLTLSDLVKFAKQFPIESEHILTLQHAFDFVNGTKREEEMVIDGVVQPPVQDAPTASYTVQAPPSYTPPRQEVPSYQPPVQNTVTETKSANKKIVLWVAVGLLLIGSFFVIRHFFSKPSFDQELVEMVSTINNACPVTLDADTRLDNAELVSATEVKFNYTLVNVQAGQIDLNVLRSKIEPAMIEQVKANPSLAGFRQHNMTMEYSYRDRNGVFLLSIRIEPADYNPGTTI